MEFLRSILGEYTCAKLGLALLVLLCLPAFAEPLTRLEDIEDVFLADPPRFKGVSETLGSGRTYFGALFALASAGGKDGWAVLDAVAEKLIEKHREKIEAGLAYREVYYQKRFAPAYADGSVAPLNEELGQILQLMSVNASGSMPPLYSERDARRVARDLTLAKPGMVENSENFKRESYRTYSSLIEDSDYARRAKMDPTALKEYFRAKLQKLRKDAFRAVLSARAKNGELYCRPVNRTGVSSIQFGDYLIDPSKIEELDFVFKKDSWGHEEIMAVGPFLGDGKTPYRVSYLADNELYPIRPGKIASDKFLGITEEKFYSGKEGNAADLVESAAGQIENLAHELEESLDSSAAGEGLRALGGRGVGKKVASQQTAVSKASTFYQHASGLSEYRGESNYWNTFIEGMIWWGRSQAPGESPDYWQQRDAVAAAAEAPDLSEALMETYELHKGSLVSRLTKQSYSFFNRMAKQIARVLAETLSPKDLAGVFHQQKDHNKAKEEEEHAKKENLYALNRRGSRATEFIIPTHEHLREHLPTARLEEWTPPTDAAKAELAIRALRLTSVEEGKLMFVTPRGHSLQSLVITDPRGKTLERGKDYVVRYDPELEVYWAEMDRGKFHIAAEFSKVPEKTGTSPSFDNWERFGSLTRDLRADGFRALSDKLDALIGEAKTRARGITLDELQTAFRESALYSYNARKDLRNLKEAGIASVFTKYKAFLDSEGRLAYQCDTANALFTEFLNAYFEGKSEIKVRREYVFSVSPGASLLTGANGHAQTVLYYNGRVQAVLDATPSELEKVEAKDDKRNAELSLRAKAARAKRFLQAVRASHGEALGVLNGVFGKEKADRSFDRDPTQPHRRASELANLWEKRIAGLSDAEFIDGLVRSGFAPAGTTDLAAALSHAKEGILQIVKDLDAHAERSRSPRGTRVQSPLYKSPLLRHQVGELLRTLASAADLVTAEGLNLAASEIGADTLNADVTAFVLHCRLKNKQAQR